MTNDTEDNKQKTVKDITSTCEISINLIFIQLHFKAIEKANAVNKNIKVLNSIVEGDDEKSAKFYGAGLHIIVAISTDEKKNITAAEALPSLLEYVLWFSGPDIKLTEDKLFNLDLSDNASTETKTKEDEEQKDKKTQKESINFTIPSFSEYIMLLEDGEEQKDNDTENNDSSDNKEDNKTDKTDETDGETAKGWYFTYNVDIKGQKEHPLSDALKSLGKKMLEGFGVQTFDWRTGANGETKTIGDLLDTLDAVFGKIDPDELKQNYDLNLKLKFPLGDPRSEIFDTKTVKQHLKKQLDSKALSKLKTAELALCTRVDKRDKSYKLYNTLLIADTVTKSIKGIFKTFKNKVDKNDVLLVNNYSDNKKDKEEKIYTGDKGEGAVSDSVISNYSNKLIIEDKNDKPDNKKIDISKISDELKKLADSNLAEYNVLTKISTSEDIIKVLSDAGITDLDLFSTLKEYKYSFMILTQQELKQKNESIIDFKSNNMMKFLFEKKLENNDTTILEKVKLTFNSFIEKIISKDKKDDINTNVIDNIIGYISDNNSNNKDLELTTTNDKQNTDINKESILNNKLLNFMHMLYESFDDTLLEKSNSQLEQDHITNDQAKLLNILIKQKTLKNIQNNKDKVNKKWGEPKQGQKDFKWPGKYKDYIDEFSKLVFDQDDENKVIDYVNLAIHNKGKNAKLLKVVLTRFIPAIKDIEDKKETINVNFYDVDPKTSEKTGDPINKEPFEVEKDSLLKDNDKINEEVIKFNEQLGKKLPEGYEFRGWIPDINTAKADKDPTEVIAKYIEKSKKDKEYTVQLMYAPDQEKPNATEPIQVDGKDDLQVKAGDAAKMPEEMPEIEGYKFKDWGDDTDKLKKVEEDIIAIANYIKSIRILAKYAPDQEKLDNLQLIEKEPKEYDSDKKLDELLPQPPDIDGFKFDKWNPSPEDIKDPKEDIEIIAEYKKADKPDESSNGNKTTVYYVIPDENNIIETELTANISHTELDFYIVPMKGLSYNTRKHQKEGDK